MAMTWRSGAAVALRCVALRVFHYVLLFYFLLFYFVLFKLCFLLSVVCRVALRGTAFGRIGAVRCGAVRCGAVRCGVIKFARVLALFSVRRRDAYIRARERVLRVSVLDGD